MRRAARAGWLAACGLALAQGPVGAPEPSCPPVPAPRPIEPRARNFIFQAWATAIGSDEASTRRKLGSPAAVERENVPNVHVACQWDELYRLLYDGLAVKRLRLRPKGEPPRELTLEVSVWSGRWRFPPGLGVGSTAADVERLLGRPSERTGEYLRYRDPEGYQASVTFALRAGRVTWIRWEIPVD